MSVTNCYQVFVSDIPTPSEWRNFASSNQAESLLFTKFNEDKNNRLDDANFNQLDEEGNLWNDLAKNDSTRQYQSNYFNIVPFVPKLSYEDIYDVKYGDLQQDNLSLFQARDYQKEATIKCFEDPEFTNGQTKSFSFDNDKIVFTLTYLFKNQSNQHVLMLKREDGSAGYLFVKIHPFTKIVGAQNIWAIYLEKVPINISNKEFYWDVQNNKVLIGYRSSITDPIDMDGNSKISNPNDVPVSLQ